MEETVVVPNCNQQLPSLLFLSLRLPLASSLHRKKSKMDVGGVVAGSGDGVGGGGAGVGNDLKSPSISDWTYTVSRRYQYLLDKSTPHVTRRWIGFAGVFFIYALRVYFVQGYYIITYGLGIYILQLFLAFLSPQVDPELQDLSDGPSLPTRGSEEFRPFVRRLPEFKFWYSITKAFCIAFVLTFFSMFDVPVFWPILLFYWMVLFVSTMKRQIMHMIKYRYVPFSFGKRRYTGKKAVAVDNATSARP